MNKNIAGKEPDNISLADLNRRLFGLEYMANFHRNRGERDYSSYAYLLKHFKLREFYNFYFTKRYVPTGEGFYRGLHSKLIKYPDKVPIPPYFEMETTTICNKKCIICEYVYWPKGTQEKRHLKLEEFKHVVDQFPVVRWVNLTGEGSSFLNKDYPLMLKYLWEKHRPSIWLVDHLCDISIEKLKKDIFPYIHGIYLSMDAGSKKTYESIKVGCDYDSVVNNLKSIIEYKRQNKTPFPHISFRYIITTKNEREMPQFLDLVNSIAPQSEWGGSTTMVEFTGLLSFKEIRKYYLNSISSSVLDELMTRKDGIQFLFTHAEESTIPPIEQCNAWLEPYIMLPGYVLPCCAVMMSNNRPFLREYSFGNVYEKSFKEIWNSEYYMKFRSMVNDPTKPVPRLCAGCRAYQTKPRIKQYGVWDDNAKDKSEGC